MEPNAVCELVEAVAAVRSGSREQLMAAVAQLARVRSWVDAEEVRFARLLAAVSATPDDDVATLNIPGIDQVVEYADELAWAVVNVPERPKFVEVSVSSPGRGGMSYLGVKPDYTASDKGGLLISGVNPGSPAEKGGLKDGDTITRIGEVKVANIEGLAEGLQKYKPGETVEIIVKRGETETTLSVTLGEPGAKPK
jgi:predicted metalloprotease with PDZ domain